MYEITQASSENVSHVNHMKALTNKEGSKISYSRSTRNTLRLDKISNKDDNATKIKQNVHILISKHRQMKAQDGKKQKF